MNTHISPRLRPTFTARRSPQLPQPAMIIRRARNELVIIGVGMLAITVGVALIFAVAVTL